MPSSLNSAASRERRRGGAWPASTGSTGRASTTTGTRAGSPPSRIRPGDVVHFDLPITGEGQVAETSTIAEVTWDFDTIYNLAGPVLVEGAAPGDTLEIEILALTPGPWGWTTVIPGLGLLADDFPEPFLKIFDLRDGSHGDGRPGRRGASSIPSSARWGCRTEEPGQHSPFPPHRGRRQRRLSPPRRRLDALAPGLVRRGALLLRRRARGTGRRRGVRQRDRVRHAGLAAVRAEQAIDPRPVASASRARSGRPGPSSRHDGHRRRPHGGARRPPSAT